MGRRESENLIDPIATHLEDLQAEIEAGSRTIDKIHTSIQDRQFKQTEVMGALARKIEELRASVRQQRETLRLLRHEIRDLRRR